MDDAALRRQVIADRIDILIDLAGHTKDSQIMVFAARPAPVTASWLGYSATTGLATMDWRITDAIADPPDAEAFYTERLMRLDGGFLCFQPAVEAPPVAPAPGPSRGHITFGSFNNQLKLNRRVIAAWAQILKAVPGSRLLIKSELMQDEGIAARLRDGITGEGIAADRIELRAPLPGMASHLAAYGEIDVALDPFPYNGTNTTCEALWMGVPVVSLVGERHSGRVGLDLLSRVGLQRLAAPDSVGYVRLAVDLVGDLGALAQLRRETRERIRASPLCDAPPPRFAREFESAVRIMWQQYCARAT